MNIIRHSVKSSDGKAISYITMGSGPGLLIVHGALSRGADYYELALACSDVFTVHVIDRRGREAFTDDEPYSISNECEDLLAVQEATGATFLFGHSFGGLITLQVIKGLQPFRKAVVYEPGVIQNGNWNWITDYRKFLSQRKYRRAFTSFVMGMGHTPLSKAPRWVASAILRLAVRGEDWAAKKDLLASNLREHEEVKRLDSAFSQYAGISVPVLLMGGLKSPASVHHVLNILSGVIPNSSTKILVGQHHLAPENREAPAVIAENIKEYLLRTI